MCLLLVFVSQEIKDRSRRRNWKNPTKKNANRRQRAQKTDPKVSVVKERKDEVTGDELHFDYVNFVLSLFLCGSVVSSVCCVFL